MQNDVWYMAMNAVPTITCKSRNNALEFSKNGKTLSYNSSFNFTQLKIKPFCLECPVIFKHFSLILPMQSFEMSWVQSPTSLHGRARIPVGIQSIFIQMNNSLTNIPFHRSIVTCNFVLFPTMLNSRNLVISISRCDEICGDVGLSRHPVDVPPVRHRDGM